MSDPLLSLAHKYLNFADEIEAISKRIMDEASAISQNSFMSDAAGDTGNLLPEVARALHEQSGRLSEAAASLKQRHEMYLSIDDSIADMFR